MVPLDWSWIGFNYAVGYSKGWQKEWPQSHGLQDRENDFKTSLLLEHGVLASLGALLRDADEDGRRREPYTRDTN